MKRIHFDYLGWDDKKNWIWLILIVLSLGFILNDFLKILEFGLDRLSGALAALGYIFLAAFSTSAIWYKNIVQWNKRGATIKIGSRWLGKSVKFAEVHAIEMRENKLFVLKNDDEKVSFDLNGIEQSDIEELNNLLVDNTATAEVY